jgi:hypothetical protein
MVERKLINLIKKTLKEKQQNNREEKQVKKGEK